MADIRVGIDEIERAIEDDAKSSRELRRELNEFIDDVHDTWVHIWDTVRAHPYETGDYRAHIKKKHLPVFGPIAGKYLKGMPVGQVYNDDENAHFIEYGTKKDKPGSRSPFGPDTPTPAFAPMRKTWAKYEI